MTKNWLTDKMVTLFRIPGIRELWAKSYQGVTSEDIPWTPLNKPLAQCRVGLVTTGGLHLRRDLPFDMNDPDGDPTFRKVPCDAEASELVITHDYYDHRDADHDLNLIWPRDVLQGLESAGHIGPLVPQSVSFMGHIDGPHLNTLIQKSARSATEEIRKQQADVVLLVPA
ncbi:MAG: glycine/sarcosine/betaine reductase selenoprotein B family protein [SAR324 cluster bacterium]|jgi:D-proline reductase (dithiol) PrdB|nr:glycine/sarcosine/betaine reductase selenoprotein B family protein [SAR324 cluster bacterium]MEC7417606.1 glycine/sarcosine/betaine reductase selenoprotein B family protein [SAR324 cluster bacterium]HIF67883.1 hypothetical protein [Candidatus Lambdaproteobacteria bacterium]HIL14724.1 hypothetical protein [Deltaproteobacteria bacterium]|tara:strand:+ start:4241 stop:4750 length:510 start_codon:yes stop_codon:yes gene_type:complete